jgi:hypothetical protein
LFLDADRKVRIPNYLAESVALDDEMLGTMTAPCAVLGDRLLTWNAVSAAIGKALAEFALGSENSASSKDA